MRYNEVDYGTRNALHHDLFSFLSHQRISRNHRYCLIKRPTEYATIKKGGDLDILVDNPDIQDDICDFLSLSSVPHTVSIAPNGNTHIDVMKEGQIDIRFDLTTGWDSYKNINVSKNFSKEVLDNASTGSKPTKTGADWSRPYLPTKEHDIIIRFIELMEYPHKTHHLPLIEKGLER